jgi:hypothetical protein
MKNKQFNKPDSAITLVSYRITDEAIDIEEAKIPKEILKETTAAYFLVQSDPASAIPQLERLVALHPKVPVLKNHLIVAYQSIGNKKVRDTLIEHMYKCHPDYLFAKCNYAKLCLVEGRIEEVAKIFNNMFDLKGLYPKRNVFHTSEFLGFMSVITEYFFRKGELENAKRYFSMLKKLESDHPSVQYLETLLQRD